MRQHVADYVIIKHASLRFSQKDVTFSKKKLQKIFNKDFFNQFCDLTPSCYTK